MKKRIIAFLMMVLIAAISTTAFAAEFHYSDQPQTTNVAITTSVTPAYTVTIPQDIKVDFSATSTEFGSITLEKALIDPGYAVQVDLNASGTLKNQADNEKTIAYTVNSGEAAFTSALFDKAGDTAALTIAITEEAWNAAYSGDYSDTVTFTVSYVKVQ